jgi:serine phosphatase RsbU (regulator of sigma subunit)
MTRTPLAVSLVMWFACGVAAAAQQPTGADTIAHVTLGQSAVPLYGPWKFTVGDSPINPKTGQPLWAEPGFDDSSWETVDLTPKDGAFNPVGGTSGFVPGWTAKGHPGYWGYAWYRIRVQTEALPGEEIALLGPTDIDDAYQFFADGNMLGAFGKFRGQSQPPIIYVSQPRMFVFRQTGTQNGSAATELLAFRVWLGPETLANVRDAGGIRDAPQLGAPRAVAAQYELVWLELIRRFAAYPICGVLFSLMALTALSLILFDRNDAVYLWLAVAIGLTAFTQFSSGIEVWTQWASPGLWRGTEFELIVPLRMGAWGMVWWTWFGLRRPAWAPGAFMVLVPAYSLATALQYDLFFVPVPSSVGAAFAWVSLAARLLFIAIMAAIFTTGIRNKGREGWLALPAVVLMASTQFSRELDLLHFPIPLRWFLLGVMIIRNVMAYLALAAIMYVLLLRRLRISLRRQRDLALDVKQAQEVQQVILPEARLVLPGLKGLPGLTIESEYRPAREVGGDFFQIIPHKSDGSVLIVAGDVTGKGLQAGMLVALLVGAIRSTAELNSDPAFVLSALNRRLMGRNDAQATCLALRIEADGAATLANAGHVAPYLNGEELPMEGALPLGMVDSAEPSVMHFQLAESDRLTLMSDGIAEAMDANGQLFGFERVHELLHTATSATEIAGAAQAFGQEDDISVISVTRIAVREPVAV